MTATNDRPRLGVGMVGYAFMGVAHSQAWRNAPRFFDLPMSVDMAVVAGRNEGAVRKAAAVQGWRDVETDWKALVVARRRRPRRRVHPRRHARRDRDHGARGRPARAVREAAGQLGRRGGGDGRCCGCGSGRRDGRFHLPPRARDPARPPARGGRPDRDRAPRARAVPAGLDRRPGCPAELAARQAEGGLGRARRHRGAHRRPRAVRHRRADHGGLGDARDLRARAPRRGLVQRPRAARRRRGGPDP